MSSLEFLEHDLKTIDLKLGQIVCPLHPLGSNIMNLDRDLLFLDVYEQFISLKMSYMLLDFIIRVIRAKVIYPEFVPVDLRLLCIIASMRHEDEIIQYFYDIHRQFMDPNDDVLKICIPEWISKFHSADAVSEFFLAHEFLWCGDIFSLFSRILSAVARCLKAESDRLESLEAESSEDFNYDSDSCQDFDSCHGIQPLSFFEVFCLIKKLDLMIKSGCNVPRSWLSRVLQEGVTISLQPFCLISTGYAKKICSPDNFVVPAYHENKCKKLTCPSCSVYVDDESSVGDSVDDGSAHIPVIVNLLIKGKNVKVDVSSSANASKVKLSGGNKLKSQLSRVIGCPPKKRGPGRPRIKPFVTKTNVKNNPDSVIEYFPVKRGPGRPPGSKNKLKDAVENVENVPVVINAELFGGRFRNNLVGTKSSVLGTSSSSDLVTQQE